jgi:hypothetical protein
MAARKRKSSARRDRTRRPQPPSRDIPDDALAVRIVFEYDGEKVRIVSSQRVNMLVPFSDPLVDYAHQQGSWIEVRDREKRPLYRQLLPHMIQSDVEGPSDSPGYPMTRRPVGDPHGMFVALVPELPAATRISLWHHPSGAMDTRTATREIFNAAFPRSRRRKAAR